jgi:hypothetical protein
MQARENHLNPLAHTPRPWAIFLVGIDFFLRGWWGTNTMKTRSRNAHACCDELRKEIQEMKRSEVCEGNS